MILLLGTLLLSLGGAPPETAVLQPPGDRLWLTEPTGQKSLVLDAESSAHFSMPSTSALRIVIAADEQSTVTINETTHTISTATIHRIELEPGTRT